MKQICCVTTVLLFLLLQLAVPSYCWGDDWSQIECIADNSSAVHYSESCNQIHSTINQSLFDHIENDTLILFFVPFLRLDEKITVRNKNGIAFRSNSSTNISCDYVPPTQPGYGFRFDAVTNLSFHNLTLINCGSLNNSTSIKTNTSEDSQEFRSAIYLLNCTNVDIRGVTITNSTGTAVTIYDCNGQINITGCYFTHNAVRMSENKTYSGGNGLYIEFSYCSPDWYSQCNSSTNERNFGSFYRIVNCTFQNNTVSRLIPESGLRSHNAKNSFRGLGKGGAGLSIIVKGNASRNTFEIDGIRAVDNRGETYCYGGAMFIHFQDTANDNVIRINNSHFNDNEAPIAGAIDSGFYFYNSNVPRGNTISIINTVFARNKASLGGGTVFFSSSAEIRDPKNVISYENCTWVDNNATTGAAAVFSTLEFIPSTNSILPTPFFTDCNFTGNRVVGNILDDPKRESASFDQLQQGSGIVYVQLFTIMFKGLDNLFMYNTGSSLYVLNGIINIRNSSTVTFFNNTAWFGGGLNLVGLSSLRMAQNSTANFTKNRAINNGGAIYVFSIDKISSRIFGLCFIQFDYLSLDTDQKEVTFIFDGNVAYDRGNAVYASTLQPCVQLCRSNVVSELSAEDTFQCIGNVSFGSSSFSDSVYTDGTIFVPEEGEVTYYIPGKKFLIPAKMHDEVGHELTSVLLRATLLNSNNSMQLESRFTHDYKLSLIGEPGEMGELYIETASFHNVSFNTNITLSQCPPGYITNEHRCRCSVLRDEWNYNGIHACNNTAFYAQASIGYWVGYIPQNDSNPFTLVTATCPLGYCNQSSYTYIQLPYHPSSAELDRALCSDSYRTGIICGNCIANHSVFYHSYHYKCGPDTYCHLGFLFYLLSEVLPLAVIFTVTIVFRLNFTSGFLNGFVLFAQMLDSLSLSANGGVLIELKSQRLALQVIHIIYSPFNLDLFYIEPLSFCLFKGFNFLQVSGVRFFTLSIALLLVLVLVLIMRCGCCYKLQLLCFKTRLTNSASLINGLSAFLVLSYGFCCRTCYNILNIAWLRGLGNQVTRGPPRVFRMGSVEYMSVEHIPYAFLAILFLVFMIILPTLFLILQPLGYCFLPERVLNWPKMRWLFTRIELLSPFLDSFQGCFKDKYRFFAGLYLLYRSIASGTFAVTNMRFETYVITEVLLILMLAVHAWIQPYRRSLHNHIDTAIFLIMITINTLTMFRYHETQVQTISQLLSISTDIQLFLVYLPAVCLLMSGLAYIVWLCVQRKRRAARLELPDIPELLFSRENLSLSDSYWFNKSREMSPKGGNYKSLNHGNGDNYTASET